MKSLLYLPAIFILLAQVARSQVDCSFQPVARGERGAIIISIDPGTPRAAVDTEITGTLSFSNPTVFFPDEVTVLSPFGVAELEHGSNYTHKFRAKVHLDADTGRVVLSLGGRALAGCERSTLAKFSDVSALGRKIDDFSCSIEISDSLYMPSYYRQPFVEFPKPNPVPSSGADWYFFLDSASVIRLYVYDMQGREAMFDDLGTMQSGPHFYRMVPGYRLSSGAYRLRLESSLGSVIKSFIVVK